MSDNVFLFFFFVLCLLNWNSALGGETLNVLTRDQLQLQVVTYENVGALIDTELLIVWQVSLNSRRLAKY